METRHLHEGTVRCVHGGQRPASAFISPPDPSEEWVNGVILKTVYMNDLKLSLKGVMV